MARNVSYQPVYGHKGLSIGFYNGRDEKYLVARAFHKGRYTEKIIRRQIPPSQRNRETIVAAIEENIKNPIDSLAVAYWREIRGEQPTFSEKLVEANRKFGLPGMVREIEQHGFQSEIINEDPNICAEEIHVIEMSRKRRAQELSIYSTDFVRRDLYPFVCNQYDSVEDFLSKEINPFTPQNVLNYTKKINVRFPNAKLIYDPPHMEKRKRRKKDTISWEPILELICFQIGLIKADAKEKDVNFMTHSVADPLKGFNSNDDLMYLNNKRSCPFYESLPDKIKKHGVVRKYLQIDKEIRKKEEKKNESAIK